MIALLSDTQAREAHAAYMDPENGTTREAVAKAYGISSTALGDHWRRIGLPMKTKKYTRKQVEAAHKDYIKSGGKFGAVADNHGFTEPGLRSAFARLGLPVLHAETATQTNDFQKLIKSRPTPLWRIRDAQKGASND